jgi:hypothetical protein
MSNGGDERERKGATYSVGGSSSSPPSLKSNDGVVLVNDTELETARETVTDTVVDVDLPSLVGNGLGLVVVHGVATAVEVKLAGGNLVTGDCGRKEDEYR